jgi:hypothetical protein
LGGCVGGGVEVAVLGGVAEVGEVGVDLIGLGGVDGAGDPVADEFEGGDVAGDRGSNLGRDVSWLPGSEGGY